MQIDDTVGSGNLFADLGLPDAEKRLAKAKLAHRISKLVDARGCTRDEAPEALGIDLLPPPASRLPPWHDTSCNSGTIDRTGAGRRG